MLLSYYFDNNRGKKIRRDARETTAHFIEVYVFNFH